MIPLKEREGTWGRGRGLARVKSWEPSPEQAPEERASLERHNSTVGMVGKDQPWDRAATAPQGPQRGTTRPSRHMPLKSPVPLLLPQLVVPGPGEQADGCAIFGISMSLWESDS